MTLSDIYTQQVLNNLAMFIQNPYALPFFAFPNQGTTQIQDSGTIGGPGYSGGHFITSPFDLNATRQATENWVLVPVSDPAKLALMRCAYREAIASCIGRDLNAETACPDCRKLRTEFYGHQFPEAGKPNGGESGPCLNSPPWFRWGCEKHAHLPRNFACQQVGSYCNVYVCVTPEGRDMLTRLTLTILDYAVNDPRQYEKRTKVVEISLDANGKPSAEKSATKITATIPIDQPSSSLVTLEKSVAYIKFLERFGKTKADALLKRAYDRLAAAKPPRRATEVNDLNFWANQDPKEYPGLEDELQFVKENMILPQDVPSGELLKGPATYERKGAASAGLQKFGQQLKAAAP